MELQELKSQSVAKGLLRAKSGRGKTLTCVKVSFEMSKAGFKVLYVDTEAEGATTMTNLIESGEYSEGVLENIEYERVSSLEELYSVTERSVQRKYDLIIIDTLDHKSTFSKQEVKDDDRAADPDWNQYAEVYAHETNVMERVNKPVTNVLATLDPDSGSMKKDKGVQTNIHGYFSIVVSLNKSGDEYTNKVVNWVGKDDYTGKSIANLHEGLAKEFMERAGE